MRHLYFALTSIFLASPLPMEACSCFGPSTFCETLNPQPPQFPEPQWWVPDHIVLGVKLSTVDYGVDLKVVQDFSGDLVVDQVIRVWGDCGLLCRMYNTDVTDGDTVLWAIQHCDLSGNFGCGMSVEEEGHYQLSVCGVYWLGYANGVVSGPLFTEGANETISLAEFGELVNGCLSTGIEGSIAPEVSVRCLDDLLSIVTTGNWSDAKEVCITDVAGRVLHEARFCGPQGALLLPRRVNGLMLVRISDGHRTVTHTVLLD